MFNVQCSMDLSCFSSLFVPLRAWAGTAHSPALNSVAKVRACACNAKRFEKFFPAFEKIFLISNPRRANVKIFSR